MTSLSRSPVNPPRSKWKRRFLGAILLLVLLAGLAPVLVAQTPLRNWAAALALPRLRGKVHVGGASLWWFSPPVFTDVEVRDADGRVLVSVPRIEGSKSLAEMLGDPTDLGEFRLTQPALQIVCSHGQTNLEDALADWLQHKDSPDSSASAREGIAVRAELVQARLLIQDEDAGKQWVHDPVEVSLAVPRDRRTPIRLQIHSRINEPEQPGQLDADLTVRLIESGSPPLRAEGELRAENFPLAAAVPFLRRFEPGLQLDGRLNAGLTLHSGDGQPGHPDESLEGRVSVRDLVLADPRLGEDRLKLERVEVPCRVALEGGRLRVEQLALTCDVGEASLSGTADFTRGVWDALDRPGHEVALKVDLARLAGLLPNTLLLSKETRLTSGGLSLHIRSAARPDGLLWEGDLRTADVQCTYQGQRIAWKEPLTVAFTAIQAPGSLPVFERFRCDSDFLRVEASGSVQQMTASASYDLGRLSEHLAGLVDLGPVRLQGQGSARLTVRRTSAAGGSSSLRGGYRLEADLKASGLRLTGLTEHPWSEDSVTVRVDLAGEATAAGTYRVNAGGLHVLAGQDGVDVDLFEPIADLLAATEGGHYNRVSVRARLHGDLARWQARLAAVADSLDGMQVGGQAELTARLRCGAEAIELADVKMAGHGIRFRGLGLSVEEPSLDLTTSGRWVWQTGALELKDARLTCPTLTANCPTLELRNEVLDIAHLRIDRARITPAACAGALGYALPVLADVAQAEGELSLELDGGRLPLADFTRAQASGRVIVHSARVSAGPLARELSVLLRAPSTLTLARDNVVPFQVVNGRVYHRDLELHFPELTVRTSGSVGLDGSLALIAETPVPPKWLGSSKLAGALARQTIRLPIGGTLSKPKLDEQALRAASERFAREAAKEVIQEELGGKLNKLLRPR